MTWRTYVGNNNRANINTQYFDVDMKKQQSRIGSILQLSLKTQGPWFARA